MASRRPRLMGELSSSSSGGGTGSDNRTELQGGDGAISMQCQPHRGNPQPW